MTLCYDQVADLVKVIDASACEELVLETAELRLVVRRHGAQAAVALASAPMPALQPPDSIPPPAPAMNPVAQPSGKIGEVCAPMVGTFYRSSSPDAPPFVEVGSVVKQDAPLAIIEVMKLFTTVYAPVGGRVVEICAANAELVEYGRVLFVIE